MGAILLRTAHIRTTSMTGPSSPLPIIEHPPPKLYFPTLLQRTPSHPIVAPAPSAPLTLPDILFAFSHHFHTILNYPPLPQLLPSTIRQIYPLLLPVLGPLLPLPHPNPIRHSQTTPPESYTQYPRSQSPTSPTGRRRARKSSPASRYCGVCACYSRACPTTSSRSCSRASTWESGRRASRA